MEDFYRIRALPQAFHRQILTIIKEIEINFGKKESKYITGLYSKWLSNVCNSPDLAEVRNKFVSYEI